MSCGESYAELRASCKVLKGANCDFKIIALALLKASALHSSLKPGCCSCGGVLGWLLTCSSVRVHFLIASVGRMHDSQFWKRDGPF